MRLTAIVVLCLMMSSCAVKAPQKLYHFAYCDKMGYTEVPTNWKVERTGNSVILSDPCPPDYVLITADENHPAVCRSMHETCQWWATPCGKLRCSD